MKLDPMTKIKRNAALLAAAATVLTLTAPLTASARPAAPLDWTTCEGSGLDPRQECATVEVPMDYTEPDGRTIGIAVSRIPAENPRQRRGVLLLIPGGPGGGSLGQPSGEGQELPREVRDRYDLIGFDPRGFGRSSPVDCELDRADLAPVKLRPWPAPDGSTTANWDTARRLAATCARDGGDLVRHISTANEARDLDRIRAALGERTVSAWGVSYGTYVGAVYNELFPHRTDRVVMDSSGDPDPARVERAWLAGFETGVEDTLPEFAAWASRPGNPYRLARTAAEVRPLLLALAARLDRDPLPWPDAEPGELNGNVLRQAVLDAFYDPDDFPALAQLVLAAREGTVPAAPPAPPLEEMRNSVAVSLATMCNDVAWPTSPAGYEKDVAESRAAYPLTAGMPRNVMPCAAWPWQPQEPPVRITDDGPATVLMVQNERDAATPLGGALKMREALGRRAVMVTADSTGHGVYLDNGNACSDRTVTRFLATGERPRRDTSC